MEPKLRSVVAFDVPADLAYKELTGATEAGLAAARAALATQGEVEANGRLASAQGGTRRVTIELQLRVPAGGAQAGLVAERAFADAFAARLSQRGTEARRV